MSRTSEARQAGRIPVKHRCGAGSSKKPKHSGADQRAAKQRVASTAERSEGGPRTAKVKHSKASARGEAARTAAVTAVLPEPFRETSTTPVGERSDATRKPRLFHGGYTGREPGVLPNTTRQHPTTPIQRDTTPWYQRKLDLGIRCCVA
ncbi:hypothetical protein GCM10022220_67030 [Actinocatenispora rupis]|uniref:Uncharacterized protein n=1 Tax=Actinocatenispora rupis TaxID=519421 RepID=A0A8J3JCW8_9ACTN|nr:hypothetical protein Aru02nite_69790 [Actinocatenispora rupis]